jgi:hypothetical protein
MPPMNDPERINALLDLADPERTSDPRVAAELIVLGLAERVGKAGFRPSTAGWSLLGALGRRFRSF